MTDNYESWRNGKRHGKRCPKGHPGIRYVSNGSCVECVRLTALENKKRKRIMKGMHDLSHWTPDVISHAQRRWNDDWSAQRIADELGPQFTNNMVRQAAQRYPGFKERGRVRQKLNPDARYHGSPCKDCGGTWRYRSGGHCVVCRAKRQKGRVYVPKPPQHRIAPERKPPAIPPNVASAFPISLKQLMTGRP